MLPQLVTVTYAFFSYSLQCQFVIVACDGVWDVMSDQEAIDVIRENVPGPGSVLGAAASRCAQLVVDAALSRGSTDNVTCLVVFF